MLCHVMSQFKQKYLPLIQDKATPAEILIIMTMIWQFCGLYEKNLKNPRISYGICLGKWALVGMAFIHLLPNAHSE